MSAAREKQPMLFRHKINGIEFSGDPFPDLNYVKWPIFARGHRIGKVTSAIYSPRLRKNIGYGWLPLELSKPGTQVTIAASGAAGQVLSWKCPSSIRRSASPLAEMP